MFAILRFSLRYQYIYVNYVPARHVMCAAYKMNMTQKEGYVWFLPGWFKERWYDIDLLR